LTDTDIIQHGESEKVAKTREFDKLLVSAIDEALNSLGESVKQSTYFHIENNFKLARDEIPENLFEFQGGLESIFGAGAQYIEILIMKNLYKKIGRNLKIKNKQLEFIEYVDSAKDGFMKKPL
jgi:poly(A) polymerase Pap1